MEAGSFEVQDLAGASSMLAKGAWMLKSKAFAKGEVDGSASKVSGGSWKKKFVWVDEGNLSYGVEERVVEKQTPLYQCTN